MDTCCPEAIEFHRHALGRPYTELTLKGLQYDGLQLCSGASMLFLLLYSKYYMHVYISCCIHTDLLHSGMQACQRGCNAFICGVQFLSKKKAHMKRCSLGTYIPL